MIELKKFWEQIKTKFATLINDFKSLSNRSERTRKETVTLEQIEANDKSEQLEANDTELLEAVEDPTVFVPIKETPNQAMPTEQPQSFPIWRNIMTRLPDEYDIPNPEIVQSFAPMTADYYRHLFPNSTQQAHLLVDEQVWMRIMAALPHNYTIPEQESI